jgi:hypothetical protein
MDEELELDFDRFIYEEITVLGGDSFYARVGCYHKHREEVTSVVTGQPVALLCLDCNQQLPVGMP